MKLQTQLATKDENLALTLKLLKIHTNLKMQGVRKAISRISPEMCIKFIFVTASTQPQPKLRLTK